jgi:hypothetical protein
MHFVGRFAAALMVSVFPSVSGCRSHGRLEPAAVAPPIPAELPARPAVAWSQDPVASASVPSGELAGVVLDAETGAPLALVQLWGPNQGLPVMSDSSGRFRIPVPNVGEVRLRRIGYAPYRVTVPRADSGLVAVIALHALPVVTCHVSGGTAVYEVDGKGRRRLTTPVEQRHPGVVVIARGALTARAPAGGISVVVRDGAFTDSVTARADTSDRIVASAAFERPGRYEVLVRSPGYRDWTGVSVARTVSECGGELRPAVFHAWLVPR